MPFFRKKPIVIEAERFDLAALPLPFARYGAVCCYSEQGWHIHTLEGMLHITPGDWIIRGVKGEFYPIKDDIFRDTYEPVQ